MAKEKNIYRELFKLAKEYKVEKNALFLTAIRQYEVQQKVIRNINEILSEADEMITTKEYVKGRENVYSHPLVKELPKHADSANKTVATILNIIQQFGDKDIVDDKLAKYLND